MRKKDLVVGQEYAMGRMHAAARVRIVEAAGVRRRVNGSLAKGTVVTHLPETEGEVIRAAAGYPPAGALIALLGSEYVIGSARWLIEPWEEFAAKRAARAASEQRQRDERQRRRELAVKVAGEMYEKYGVDLTAPGVDLSAATSIFTFTADLLAELLGRLDPVAAVRRVLAEVEQEGPFRAEDDYREAVDAAVGRLEQSLMLSADERAGGPGEAF